MLPSPEYWPWWTKVEQMNWLSAAEFDQFWSVELEAESQVNDDRKTDGTSRWVGEQHSDRQLPCNYKTKPSDTRG